MGSKPIRLSAEPRPDGAKAAARQRGRQGLQLHAPEVESSVRAKPHKPYGSRKVSVATPQAQARVVSSSPCAELRAIPIRPTLAEHDPGDRKQLVGNTIQRLHADAGHNARRLQVQIYTSKQKRRSAGNQTRDETPLACEPVIGHLKEEHRMAATISPTAWRLQQRRPGCRR